MGRIGQILAGGGTLKVRVIKPFDWPYVAEDGMVRYRPATPENLPYLLILSDLDGQFVRLEPDPKAPDAPAPPDLVACLVRHSHILDGEEGFHLQVVSFSLRNH